MITLSNLMGFWKRSPHLQRSDLRNWPPPTVCWLVRLIWAEAIRVVIRAGITPNLGLRCEVNFASATWKSAGSFLINLAWLPASASKSSQPRVDKPHMLENQTGLGEGTTGRRELPQLDHSHLYYSLFWMEKTRLWAIPTGIQRKSMFSIRYIYIFFQSCIIVSCQILQYNPSKILNKSQGRLCDINFSFLCKNFGHDWQRWLCILLHQFKPHSYILKCPCSEVFRSISLFRANITDVGR